jgi:hypothetical protein
LIATGSFDEKNLYSTRRTSRAVRTTTGRSGDKKVASPSSLRVGWYVAFLCASPAYADTIYECTGKDGAKVLQNMPCDAASDGRMPDGGDAGSASVAAGSAQSSPGAAEAAPNVATPMDSPGSRSARPDAAAAANGAASPAGGDDAANLPSEPELGMTQQQVRAILGAPTSITQEEVVQGREVTWSYGDRVLQFDTEGRLTKK